MDQVFIGVDTHKANHIAVALNAQGARLGTITIAANEDGYRRLDAWANRLGRVTAFGIEGTGSYGAGLSRDLQARGHTVLDVMRPNRQLRYLHGKSDCLDAEGAARSVLNGQATAIAKSQGGTSEMIRHLKVARDSAVKAKSQAMITLKTLIINALLNYVPASNIFVVRSLWCGISRPLGPGRSSRQWRRPNRRCGLSRVAGLPCTKRSSNTTKSWNAWWPKRRRI